MTNFQLILILLLSSTNVIGNGIAENHFIKFPMNNIYQVDSHLSSQEVKSLFDCSLVCQTTNKCVGFNFIEESGTKTCEILGTTQTARALQFKKASTFYQKMPKCENECGNSSSCYMALNGTTYCRCNKWPEFCGPNCEHEMFNGTYGYFLPHGNVEIFLERTELQECKVLCLSRDYCRSFDFEPIQKKCYLQGLAGASLVYGGEHAFYHELSASCGQSL